MRAPHTLMPPSSEQDHTVFSDVPSSKQYTRPVCALNECSSWYWATSYTSTDPSLVPIHIFPDVKSMEKMRVRPPSSNLATKSCVGTSDGLCSPMGALGSRGGSVLPLLTSSNVGSCVWLFRRGRRHCVERAEWWSWYFFSPSSRISMIMEKAGRCAGSVCRQCSMMVFTSSGHSSSIVGRRSSYEIAYFRPISFTATRSGSSLLGAGMTRV
mmetsp:Transcript_4062/g.10009  ORF Transcript_4062/g.10009 Transcript_4062/m.10009 type:complete len:212 (-) Transcript_4062:1451-2086(-)